MFRPLIVHLTFHANQFTLTSMMTITYMKSLIAPQHLIHPHRHQYLPLPCSSAKYKDILCLFIVQNLPHQGLLWLVHLQHKVIPGVQEPRHHVSHLLLSKIDECPCREVYIKCFLLLVYSYFLELLVGALDSRLSRPDSSLGWRHCVIHSHSASLRPRV